MVITNLRKVDEFDEEELNPPPFTTRQFPYRATFLHFGKEKIYKIMDKNHLAQLVTMVDRTESCPSPAEFETMVGNFPQVFENNP